jgi:predicted dinucleotide-binding enzyme
MKIAIIGAGNVGGTLGSKLAEKGHQICYGVRNINDAKYDKLKAAANSSFTSVPEAVTRADVVLLATPWGTTKQAIESCGSLRGKVVIDCTNPIKADFSGLDVDNTTSGAEMIAMWAPGAKVVKCFNQTGFNNMAQPVLENKKSVMFAAGNDADAVSIAASLAEDVGFETIKLNDLSLSRQLEHLAWLWIHMAMKQNYGRDFAFGILRR